MDSKQPRTAQEAVYAVLFQDIDALTKRIEALPDNINTSVNSLDKTISVLRAASENYRKAMLTFTSEARDKLTDHVQARSAAILDAQRKEIQDVARAAMDLEMQSNSKELLYLLQANITHLQEVQRSRIGIYIVLGLMIIGAFWLGKYFA